MGWSGGGGTSVKFEYSAFFRFACLFTLQIRSLTTLSVATIPQTRPSGALFDQLEIHLRTRKNAQWITVERFPVNVVRLCIMLAYMHSERGYNEIVCGERWTCRQGEENPIVLFVSIFYCIFHRAICYQSSGSCDINLTGFEMWNVYLIGVFNIF